MLTTTLFLLFQFLLLSFGLSTILLIITIVFLVTHSLLLAAWERAPLSQLVVLLLRFSNLFESSQIRLEGLGLYNNIVIRCTFSFRLVLLAGTVLVTVLEGRLVRFVRRSRVHHQFSHVAMQNVCVGGGFAHDHGTF